MMAATATGKSNWENASTRSKARKAGLIDETRMRQLLQQSPASIAASIAELGYRADIDLYADRLVGADLIETALNHNMDRDLQQVLRFCQGELKSLVGIFVERFAYQKAKTTLRAVRSGASYEMVSQRVLPEENSVNQPWLEIVRQSNNLADAVAALSGTKFGKPLSEVDDVDDLMALEDALDSHYYRTASELLRFGSSQTPLLLRYLRSEIDFRNTINQFRAIRQGLTSEQRSELMIAGGRALDTVILRQASEADSDQALLEILSRAPAFDDTGLDEAIIEAQAKGTLDPIANTLTHQRLEMLNRMAMLNPISAFPVIHYIERKVLENHNLRLLARGKAAGLPDDLIESHMMF